MDYEDLCRWRAYFRSSRETIFDVIENAIAVAALDQPWEFKVQREKIVMKLYGCDLPSFSNCDSELSEAARNYSHHGICPDESRGSKSMSARDDANVKHDGEDKDGEGLAGTENSEDDCNNFCSREGDERFAVKAKEENSTVKAEEDPTAQHDYRREQTINDNVNEDAKMVKKNILKITLSGARVLRDETAKDNKTGGCSVKTGVTSNDHVSGEAKTVKVEYLKKDTSSGAQVWSNEMAKGNRLIKDNDRGSFSVKEALILEEVSKIKRVLVNSQNHNDEVIVELLRKLLRMDFTMKTVKATMIGEIVSPLGKHGLREIRHLVRDLIAKWKVVVDEALDKPASNADDKISEGCLGDHNIVQDGSSNGKETSLDLEQELHTDSFFKGLAPISPSIASMDLQTIFEDVDENYILSLLPADDDNETNELSILEMLNDDEEQCIHEKPSVKENQRELNQTGKTEIRPRKETTERALPAKESNQKGKCTIKVKYKPETIKTSHPSHQPAYSGRKMTADVKESSSKAIGTSEAKYNPDSTVKSSQKLKRTEGVQIMTLEKASKVIKAGYQRAVKKRRVVQMLDQNDLNELYAKNQSQNPNPKK